MEWKRAYAVYSWVVENTLETFLGGMETRAAGDGAAALGALKPSLVEWKPNNVYDHFMQCIPLKPSLVEWKHSCTCPWEGITTCLETFLGGMETL